MERLKLGDICKIVSGGTPKTNIKEYWDGDKKWITPAELNDNSYIIADSVRKLTEFGVLKTGLTPFPEGTVILSSRAPIGKVAIASCEMYCNQGFKNFICTDKIYNKYLYWFLRSKTAYLNSLGRGATTYDYFDSTQVKNLPLNYEPILEHLVKVGDVIVSRMNTSELVGAAAYVWKVPKNTYLPDRLWRAELKDNCNPIFVWQVLIQPSTKEQIRREASGTSGSMKNISKSGLLAIKVKKVSAELQNQFADFVTQADKLKSAA